MKTAWHLHSIVRGLPLDMTYYGNSRMNTSAHPAVACDAKEHECDAIMIHELSRRI